MFAKLFGLLWIVLGILWLIKPEMLRSRLKKKMTRKVMWLILGIVFLLLVQLFLLALGSRACFLLRR